MLERCRMEKVDQIGYCDVYECDVCGERITLNPGQELDYTVCHECVRFIED